MNIKILTAKCGSINSIFAFYNGVNNICTPAEGLQSSRIFSVLDALNVWSNTSIGTDGDGGRFLVHLVSEELKDSPEIELIDTGLTIDQLYYDEDDMEATNSVINTIVAISSEHDMVISANEATDIVKSMSGLVLSYFTGSDASELHLKWFGRTIPEYFNGKVVEKIFNESQTLAMNNEESSLFIQLPTAKQLLATMKSNVYDYESQSVDSTAIFKGNENSYSFLDIGVRTDVANGMSGPISNMNMIDLSVLPIDSKVTDFYSYFYIETAPIDSFKNGYGPEAILGSTSNNSMDIQDNEREFFESARNLYVDCISLENMIFSDDLFASQYINKSSTIADTYFSILAEQAYNLGQAHTGQTLSRDVAASDEEDSVSKFDVQFGSIEKMPDGTYILRNSMSIEAFEAAMDDIPGSYQGFYLLTGYLNNFCKSNGKWIEALIKLCRWGNRKPTHLCISDAKNDKGEPMYFELKTSQITGFNGDRNSLIKKLDENGSNLQIRYIMTVPLPTGEDFAMTIKKYYSNMPNDLSNQITIGVYLSELYTDNTGREIDFPRFEDIFMLSERIKQGCEYSGIRYDSESDTISFSNNPEFVQLSVEHLQDSRSEISLPNSLFREQVELFSEKLSKKNCNLFSIFSILTENGSDLSIINQIQNGLSVLQGEENTSPFPDWQCYMVYQWLPKLMYVSRGNSLEEMLNLISGMPNKWHTSITPDFINIWTGDKADIQFSPIMNSEDTIGYICIAAKMVDSKKVRVYLLVSYDDLDEINSALQAKAVDCNASYSLSTTGTPVNLNVQASSKSINTWRDLILKMIDKYRIEGVASPTIKMATSDTANSLYQAVSK